MVLHGLADYLRRVVATAWIAALGDRVVDSFRALGAAEG
jgi:hypothetical protein